jgi:hypothetical protein
MLVTGFSIGLLCFYFISKYQTMFKSRTLVVPKTFDDVLNHLAAHDIGPHRKEGQVLRL